LSDPDAGSGSSEDRSGDAVPWTRYPPMNQRARSTARQRGEQNGKEAFSSLGFTGPRQLGQACM